jgi:TonB-dependent SusC/RagA subfamily outer membrane receptor
VSLSLTHASLVRVASILACWPSLVALGGCHHRAEPSPAERVAAARGRPSNDDRVLRRFPGVDVASTQSGGFVIRIQGGLVGDGEPLYIIDGTPMNVDPRSGITWFKPEDVLWVSVLKGPAERAVYGPRGVNGVILITTKQGAIPRT